MSMIGSVAVPTIFLATPTALYHLSSPAVTMQSKQCMIHESPINLQ